MLDDAGDRVKPRGQRLGIRDRAKGAVEDQMAAVGDEGRADFFARRYFALQPKFARTASTCSRVARAPKLRLDRAAEKRRAF